MVTARAALVAGIRAVLVLALALCSVLHTLPDNSAHTASPVLAAASASPSGELPHQPHTPHDADHCAADITVRTTEQSPEGPPFGALALALLGDAGAAALVPTRPRRAARGRCRGRTALARTSRWRI